MSNRTIKRPNILTTIVEFPYAPIEEKVFEIAQTCVVKSRRSTQDVKSLTKDIIHDVSETRNLELMLKISKTVNLWNKGIDLQWESELVTYAKQNTNVVRVIASKGDSVPEFVIILKNDDMQDILDCNEFCFSILEKYRSISEFYVFTESEYSGINSRFSDFDVLYE